MILRPVLVQGKYYTIIHPIIIPNLFQRESRRPAWFEPRKWSKVYDQTGQAGQLTTYGAL